MKWFLIFLCLPAFGQLPVLPFAPSSASSSGPLSVSGMALYWNHSDLIVGQNVSNWVDEIQGKLWTNRNSAKWPTNAAQGVYFDGVGTVLTNDGSFSLATAGKFTIWAVIKTVQDGDGGTQRAFLSQPNYGPAAGQGLYWFNHKFTPISGPTVYFSSITNIYQDWIFQTDGNNPHNWYTNNVSTAGNNWNIQVAGDMILFNLGQNPGVNNGWFYLAELGLYTNDISSGDRTTLHNYAISKYSVNP